jgi:hypothetical protein
MGRIRKLKNTRRKGTNQENSRKQEGNNGGKKEEICAYMEVPILVCLPLLGDALRLPHLCDPPSGEPTHMGISLTTSQDWEKTLLLLSSS